MRILFTHELFLPAFVGGGEKIVYEIAKRLSERHDIEVITTGNSSIKSYRSIKTTRLPINRFLFNLSFPVIARKATDFDLIQTFTFNACLPSFIASKLANKPIVCWVLGVYSDLWCDIRGKMGKFYKFFEKVQVNRNYDRITFMGEFARKIGLKIGIPIERTEVIPPGVNYKKFKSRKKEPYVLFVGRLSKQKGIHYLIEAAKQLPDIKFVIIGTGEEEERLKMKASKNIEFVGFLPSESKQLIDYYAKALVFCLPSVGEGFGISILEAMSSGCAVLSTIPLDYNGMTIRPKNVSEIVNGIKKLFRDKQETKKLGKKNRNLAKSYTWDRSIKMLERTYESLY